MNLGEDEIIAAIESLRERSLVFETSGGRAMRYEHNFERAVGVLPEPPALLEPALNCCCAAADRRRAAPERGALARFADIGSVEVFQGTAGSCQPGKGRPAGRFLRALVPRAALGLLLCRPVDGQFAVATAATSPAVAGSDSLLIQSLDRSRRR